MRGILTSVKTGPAAGAASIARLALAALAVFASLASAGHTQAPSRAVAIFAGGCFWSMQRPLQRVPGVLATTVGYTGGRTPNPTYQQVNTGKTGHAEAVEVVYDPSRLTYETLLNVYWRNIDPLTKDRQFCDGGSDYRTAIFYTTREQRTAAEESKRVLSARFTRPIVTEIVAASTFWRAEEYHQNFAERNPEAYAAYRRGCGRDARLRQIWGDSAAPYVPES